MQLEREYTIDTIVYFGDTIQPALKARLPFPHKPHRELKRRTRKPKEREATRGDLINEKKATRGDPTTPINEPREEGKDKIRERRETELRTSKKTIMTWR